MPEIIEFMELRFDGDDNLIVEALLAVDSDQATGKTTLTLCRGSMYFPEDALIPATDAELRRMLEERIHDWEPILQGVEPGTGTGIA